MAKKVLVVDDDFQIIDFVTFSLKRAGYEVYSAEDGQQGLDMIRKVLPDLVILDLNMPVMHGFQVCQKVREDKDLSNVKIMVTSAKSYAADVKAAKNLGADSYLIKPYGYQKLLDAVGELLPAIGSDNPPMTGGKENDSRPA